MKVSVDHFSSQDSVPVPTCLFFHSYFVSGFVFLWFERTTRLNSRELVWSSVLIIVGNITTKTEKGEEDSAGATLASQLQKSLLAADQWQNYLVFSFFPSLCPQLFIVEIFFDELFVVRKGTRRRPIIK
ncbi:hypothetical protein Patl1_34328 [Pistacia atlantica]|uniref:Uncharacterized protein n=1 Tax=Pistacia atlantica TaxID=434234 RepID=A0ACC0ZSS5_9ROSI|nr:hypothetical protein Patl1_34328 [Pistacia atlantica]